METTAGAVASAIKMIKKIILLATGLVIFSLGCATALNARDWLSIWQRAQTSGSIYLWTTCLIMTVTNYLTVLAILSALRSGNPKDETLVTSDTGNIYRYPHRTVVISFIASLALSELKFISDDPNKPTPLAANIMEFCFLAASLMYTVHAAKFYIKINPEEMTIGGFLTKKLLTTNIAKIYFGNIKGLRAMTIILNNNRKYSIGGTLKNHYQLVETLMTCVRKNGGRWFSDDYYISKHFKKSVG